MTQFSLAMLMLVTVFTSCKKEDDSGIPVPDDVISGFFQFPDRGLHVVLVNEWSEFLQGEIGLSHFDVYLNHWHYLNII